MLEGDTALASFSWLIICVVLIIGLAYWFTRYVAVRGVPGTQSFRESEQFKVLSRLALGREESLALVRAGERYFLLGITHAGISNLAEFSGEEAEGWLNAQAAQPAPPSFREAVQLVLGKQQRKQR